MKPKRKHDIKKTNATEAKLRELAFLSIDNLYDNLESSSIGLSINTAEDRLEEYGPNVITIDIMNNIFTRLLSSIINPFNIVLIVIAIITFFTDIVLSEGSDYLTISIILFLVFISSMVAFIQGERSNRTAEKLSQSITNKADVIRDNKVIEIDIKDIVIGDIVKLSAGDMIPADVRFILAKDAFIAQASLTGESNPIEKFSSINNNSNVTITDLSNIGFMGSNMVSGTATAIVLTTGNDTYFGSMAKTLSDYG